MFEWLCRLSASSLSAQLGSQQIRERDAVDPSENSRSLDNTMALGHGPDRGHRQHGGLVVLQLHGHLHSRRRACDDGVDVFEGVALGVLSRWWLFFEYNDKFFVSRKRNI